MSELESNLEGFFQHQVRRAGGRAYKVVPTTRGMPDRLALFPGGRVYLVELKRDRGHGALRPDQEVWHAKAEQMGVNVAVLWGKAEILDWLEEVKRGNDS